MTDLAQSFKNLIDRYDDAGVTVEGEELIMANGAVRMGFKKVESALQILLGDTCMVEIALPKDSTPQEEAAILVGWFLGNA